MLHWWKDKRSKKTLLTLVKSWDINKSSQFIVLAFATALLMSLIGYPLRVKFLIRVCDALANKLSVLHIHRNQRA